MKVPTDLRYTKEHEWVRVDNGVATVGITEFAQSELGEIVFVELPADGASVSQGDSLCVVESTKAASDVYAPLSGTVQTSNAGLADAPETVNASPYEEGWLVVLEGISAAEIEGLLTPQQYQELISEQ